MTLPRKQVCLPWLVLLCACGSERAVGTGPASRARLGDDDTRLIDAEVSDDAEFGFALAAGDLDGDGYADLAVGSPFVRGSTSGEGAVLLHQGSATGLPPHSDERLVASDAAEGDELGTAVAFVGDVDGDGFGDLLLGVDVADGSVGGASSGMAYLRYGALSGIDSSRELRLEPADGSDAWGLGIDVAAAGDVDGDGLADVIIGVEGGSPQLHLGGEDGLDEDGRPVTSSDTLAADAGFGRRVAGAGDIDGDGYADILVAAPGFVGEDDALGAVHAFYGAADGIDPGRESRVRLSDASLGDAAPSVVFGSSVAGLGDLDDDGYDDVVIGAVGVGSSDRGTAWTVTGGSDGLEAEALDLVFVAPLEASAELGAAVHGPGDLDGDGRVDLVFGDPGSSYAWSRGGLVGVAFGDDAGLGLGGLVDLFPDLDSHGDDPNSLGHALASGDFDGDGYVDVVAGDPDYRNDGDAWGAAWVFSGDCERLWYDDVDGDGFGDPDSAVEACGQPTDMVGDGHDCDDSDGDVNPAATESWYDGIDSDCDGANDYDADGDGETSSDHGGDDCDDADPEVEDPERFYRDADEDGYGAVDDWVVACPIPDGYVEDSTDCDDAHADAHPGGTEVWYDGVDGDCAGDSDYDADGDGQDRDSDGGTDCDDTDADIYLGAFDWWYDGIDSNCDGADDYDHDEDGQASAAYGGTDCDDNDAAVMAGGVEVTGDGVDQDCDGAELCWADSDGDGYRSDTETVLSDDDDCSDPGEAWADSWSGDCDDDDPLVHPGRVEVVGNDVDEDCDGSVQCYADADLDGVRSDALVDSADADCDDPGEASADTPDGDCDDGDGSVHPGAAEGVADGLDSDCDGDELCWFDDDGDGWLDSSSSADRATIDSADLDCLDRDEAGSGAGDGDCDDQDPAAYPGATEIAGDGIDQDCDGADAAAEEEHEELDGDGGKKGCVTGPGLASWLALLPGLVLLRRRRA